jgi:hypothetical protein
VCDKTFKIKSDYAYTVNLHELQIQPNIKLGKLLNMKSNENIKEIMDNLKNKFDVQLDNVNYIIPSKMLYNYNIDTENSIWLSPKKANSFSQIISICEYLINKYKCSINVITKTIKLQSENKKYIFYICLDTKDKIVFDGENIDVVSFATLRNFLSNIKITDEISFPQNIERKLDICDYKSFISYYLCNVSPISLTKLKHLNYIDGNNLFDTLKHGTKFTIKIKKNGDKFDKETSEMIKLLIKMIRINEKTIINFISEIIQPDALKESKQILPLNVSILGSTIRLII